MTAITWTLEEKQVLIASDTLVIGTEDRLPINFAAKIFPIPHLQGAMCGGGEASIFLRWFVRIHENILAQNMFYLNECGPAHLRDLAQQHGTPGVKTFVYHFGWDADEERFRAFAFKSDLDFEPCELQYGFGILPGGRNPEETTKTYEAFRSGGLRKVLFQLREMEDMRPLFCKDEDERRIQIGGEIHQLALKPDGYVFSVCDRFADFKAMFAEMLARCGPIAEALSGGEE